MCNNFMYAFYLFTGHFMDARAVEGTPHEERISNFALIAVSNTNLIFLLCLFFCVSVYRNERFLLYDRVKEFYPQCISLNVQEKPRRRRELSWKITYQM